MRRPVSPGDLAELLYRPAWMADALCKEPAYRGLPWVPYSRLGDAALAEMRGVCERCLVAGECAAYAASRPGVRGVFAGAPVRLKPR
jgi:hypothetical protein